MKRLFYRFLDSEKNKILNVHVYSLPQNTFFLFMLGWLASYFSA